MPENVFYYDIIKEELHKEILNLSFDIEATIQSKSISTYYNILEKYQEIRVWTQRKIPNSIREYLAREIGNNNYNIKSPFDLKESLQTDRWKLILEKISNRKNESFNTKTNLIRLLMSLGFHKYIVNTFEEIIYYNGEISESILQYCNALAHARFIDARDNWSINKKTYNPYDFWYIVNRKKNDSPATCSALIFLLIYYISDDYQDSKIKYISDKLLQNLDQINDNFIKKFYLSIYHRAFSILPAKNNDYLNMTYHMDLADSISLNLLDNNNEYYNFIGLENRYSVLESRIKEKVIADEKEECLKYAKLLQNLDPLDSRALMSVADSYALLDNYEDAGYIYLKAATYGVYYTRAAYYMAGQCFNIIEDKELALYCFSRSLAIDDHAESVIEDIADLDLKASIVEWAKIRSNQVE